MQNCASLTTHRITHVPKLYDLFVGVTVPTLHVGMLYTASCWSTDNNHLPYVQYLHGETDIVWLV